MVTLTNGHTQVVNGALLNHDKHTKNMVIWETPHNSALVLPTSIPRSLSSLLSLSFQIAHGG